MMCIHSQSVVVSVMYTGHLGDWETGIPVWAPKFWCPKSIFQVLFFQLYFNKKIY